MKLNDIHVPAILLASDIKDLKPIGTFVPYNTITLLM